MKESLTANQREFLLTSLLRIEIFNNKIKFMERTKGISNLIRDVIKYDSYSKNAASYLNEKLPVLMVRLDQYEKYYNRNDVT
jgi:hypothetical protein